MRTSNLLAILPLAAATVMKRAPLHTREANALEDKYIVKMKSGSQVDTASVLDSAISAIASDADHVFNKFGGFAASLTADEVDKLRDNPDVEYIEQDAKAQLYDGGDEHPGMQLPAPWHLARLSSPVPGQDHYIYGDDLGQGVCAYIIDTGIDATHPEFGGRAEFVSTFVDGIKEDDNGHGTHVAGIVGSKTYGVAKKVKLYAIKIFDADGNGTGSLMIKGMEAVLDDAPKRECPKGVVVNMSFGIEKSQAVNDAAAELTKAGYFAAVAAGNGDLLGNPLDAGNFSPASESSACTVGATQPDDKVASFSNYGKVLDVFAPGVSVKSTVPGNNTAVYNGTSMASPIVAGLGATFLQSGLAPVDKLCHKMKDIALVGTLKGVRNGTDNYLVQNGLYE